MKRLTNSFFWQAVVKAFWEQDSIPTFWLPLTVMLAINLLVANILLYMR